MFLEQSRICLALRCFCQVKSNAWLSCCVTTALAYECQIDAEEQQLKSSGIFLKSWLLWMGQYISNRFFCWVLKTRVVRIDTGIFSNFICPWNSKVYNHFKILADGARDKDSFVGISKNYRISGTLWNLILSKWGLSGTSDRPQQMPSPL